MIRSRTMTVKSVSDYTAYKLRDPVHPNRYWNGACVVPKSGAWPHSIKATGIKFSGRGKRWTSREAALKAYAEYEITVALIYMKKAAINGDRLPTSLELVEIEVAETVKEVSKLPGFKHAAFIAGHRVASGENRTHMEVALKALKHEAADSFKYMVRFPPLRGQSGPHVPGGYAERAAHVKAEVAKLGIASPYSAYPFFFLTNDADLMGIKLAFDGLRAWEFTTGKQVI